MVEYVYDRSVSHELRRRDRPRDWVDQRNRSRDCSSLRTGRRVGRRDRTRRERRLGGAVAEIIEETSGDARFVAADLRSDDEIRRLVSEGAAAFDSIDHVVNNAAVVTTEDAADCSPTEWDTLMRVNLRAYWLVAKYSLAHIDRGTITNVSSIHATSTVPESFPYNVSKTGVTGLTRALAVDLGPAVRVNSVEPGQVRIERNESVVAAQDAEVPAAYPLERLGDPSEIASVVAFLASDAAGFLTGANVPVDGGLHCVQPAYWNQP